MNAFGKLDTTMSPLAPKEHLETAMAIVRSTLANVSSGLGASGGVPSAQSAPILDIVQRSLATANSWMPTQLREAPPTGHGGVGQMPVRDTLRGLPGPYGSTWPDARLRRIGRAQGGSAADCAPCGSEV